MENLFYSPTECILFWIAPYIFIRDEVHLKIADMTKRCTEFAMATGVPFNDVKVRTFKDREVYWVEDQTIKVGDEVGTFTHNGKEVFNIGKHWYWLDYATVALLIEG